MSDILLKQISESSGYTCELNVFVKIKLSKEYLYVDEIGIESVRKKTNNLGSCQVRHKPACTVTEDG